MNNTENKSVVINIFDHVSDIKDNNDSKLKLYLDKLQKLETVCALLEDLSIEDIDYWITEIKNRLELFELWLVQEPTKETDNNHELR